MNTWNRRFIYVRYKRKDIIDFWKRLPILRFFSKYFDIFYIKLKYASVSGVLQSVLHGIHLKDILNESE